MKDFPNTVFVNSFPANAAMCLSSDTTGSNNPLRASRTLWSSSLTIAVGRFLPQDKLAFVAKILNQVWEAA